MPHILADTDGLVAQLRQPVIADDGRLGVLRFEISDEAAITFAGRVYRVIAQRFPIDAAMAAAAGDAQAVVTLDRKQTPTTATAA